MKRLQLFLGTNLAIVMVLSVTMRLLGAEPDLNANGLSLTSLLIFAAVIGFGGSFISLAIFKWSEKNAMGVNAIETPANAFAAGMSKNSALFAEISGLLQKKPRQEAAITHEMTHATDRVTLAPDLLTKARSCLGLMLFALLVAGCATPAASRPPAPTPELKPTTLALPPLGKDTPAPQESPSQGIPHKPIVEENIIYFAPGSTRIDLAGEQKLRIHASRLVDNRKTIVTLIGLTDNQGSRSFNLAIAEQRIEAAAKILRTHGVLKNQIRLYARGNKTPDFACKTEACREKMRRVELHYENP